MATLAEALGVNLPPLLEEKRISQSELARRLDLSIQTVNAYCRGRAKVSPDTLARIAGELGVEETQLVADPKARTSQAEWDAVKRALIDREKPTLSDEWRKVVEAFPTINERESKLILTMLEDRRAAVRGNKKPSEPLFQSGNPRSGTRNKK